MSKEEKRKIVLEERENIARLVALAGLNSIPVLDNSDTFTGTYWISANMLYFTLTGRHLNDDVEKGNLPANEMFDSLTRKP